MVETDTGSHGGGGGGGGYSWQEIEREDSLEEKRDSKPFVHQQI
jgi:hypothetical protein